MKKVLIVDDEPIVLDVLSRILSRIGYQTNIAETWHQAMEIFREEPSDLVILDVLMPGKNGFEIAREMRKTRSDQIIVMISGMDIEEVMARASREAVFVDDILSKPFSCTKLASVIQRVFDYREVLSDSQVICGCNAGDDRV